MLSSDQTSNSHEQNSSKPQISNPDLDENASLALGRSIHGSDLSKSSRHQRHGHLKKINVKNIQVQHDSIANTPKRSIDLTMDNDNSNSKAMHTERKMLIKENASNGSLTSPPGDPIRIQEQSAVDNSLNKVEALESTPTNNSAGTPRSSKEADSHK